MLFRSDHRLVTAMNAVKIADSDHAAVRGGRDVRKMSIDAQNARVPPRARSRPATRLLTSGMQATGWARQAPLS